MNQIPQSLEAEQTLIGIIIIDGNQFKEINEKITPQMFYDEKHQKIYDVFLHLYRDGQGIDLITFKNKAEELKYVSTVFEINYVTEIAENVIDINATESYIKILIDKFLLRELLKQTQSVTRQIYENTPFDDVIDTAEKGINTIVNNRSFTNLNNWDFLLKNTYEKIMERYHSESSLIGLTTGYDRLDHLTYGLQGGEFIIIAARPSMGKTAFALNLARNVAHHNKVAVGIFSLEMGYEQLLQRMIATEANLPIANIKLGQMTSQELNQMNLAIDSLSHMDLLINDQGGMTIGNLKTEARKMKKEKNIEILIIDYLQLLSGSKNRQENRQQEVSDISRELKGLAKELNIPIVALSQLSRKVEERHDKRPMMSDLRESGAIEQDADIIMGLYREEYYVLDENERAMLNEQKQDGNTELIILKNRNGELGIINLKFFKESSKFLERVSR